MAWKMANIFNWIFPQENVCIFVQILLELDPKYPTDDR